MKEVQDAVEALEALPLLGRGLAQARALDARLVDLLLRHPDPALATRALIRRGERQLVEGDEAAPETLAEAARRCLSLGASGLELRCRLLAARALAALGSLADAQALLARAEVESAGVPELALERALARAAVGAHGAADELAAALDVFEPIDGGADPEAHDHFAAAVALAEALSGDARWREADRRFAEAAGLARDYADPAAVARVCLARGASLLRHGRAPDAVPHLRAALEGPSLVRLAAGLLLSGVLLEAGALDEADAVAEATQTLAEQRRNWLAFSAAALDRVRSAELRGDAEAARARLVDALVRCRAEGEPGPLLQARWLEMESDAPDPE
ncbi:MAG: hypothetical protein H6739_13515 [Alphaproteobacteria bacterium]|nr:hypothetical protein [Alphaproteobacteria bacterium]